MKIKLPPKKIDCRQFTKKDLEALSQIVLRLSAVIPHKVAVSRKIEKT